MLDPASGEFKYSNAGHIPFIRANHRKREIELLKDATSVPLGILPQIDVGQESVQLDRGDCIVLVTDGIIEAKNHNDEEYSLERVMKKLSKRQGSVDEVVNRLIADVQEFSNHRSQFDDLTILAFRLE
ncbi:serine/threonine-protein phosphatase [candidate division KSB1 bacterium]|nr:serine/threonine-protein phosphatase [candidate division KSB1 bacterium]NIR70797.1 serine/threonine-protein phosphatase [candidate division KSB1 bacterium]NIS27810.1 serine/threonine-protein phosphatase [candidate division KSB1 bacterium]NIT74692.1 serine/threonine-protein phosphatase [candidate division KSB1 bacterium]NIU28477.1 serine/threonine-protein phosphatase [candidate division KSB1 bacterium]